MPTEHHDLLANAPLAQRFELYARMQATEPAASISIDGHPTVVVTRFADVDALLKDSSALVQPSPMEFPEHIGSGEASVFYRLSLPHIDPPQHAQFRAILGEALGPGAIARLQTMVGAIIENALDAIAPREAVEVVQAFSARIPADVACGMLHIPAERKADLFARVQALNAIVSHNPLSAQALREADEAARYYFQFFNDLVAAHPNLPADDLVGSLIGAYRQGRWSGEALATTLLGLFLASFHTTRTAISNVLHALATYPDQYRILRQDPTLSARAWEEALRYNSPVHFVHRYASERTIVAGSVIAPRTRLLLGLAAANRDSSRFASPHTFDITRDPARHLAFAMGRHFCAGVQLSRMEGKILLEGLARRFAALHVSEANVQRHYDLTFPFIEKMTLQFEAAR